ncbi:MAG: hypothetical protein U1E84_15480 [Rhodoferax sp.]
MKNVFTTTALILACGAAFAGTPTSGEFSSVSAINTPSTAARADVKAEVLAARQAQAGLSVKETSAHFPKSAPGVLSRAAVKADYLQAQKAGTLPLMGERS